MKLVDEPSKYASHVLLRPVSDERQTERVISEGALYRPGDTRAQSLRVVCADCNGKWLKKIQDTANPILTRLHEGEWWALSVEEQRAIANWAAAFTMTWEFADRKTVAIPQSDRDYIRLNGTPPPDWRIWIGEYSGETWKSRAQHKALVFWSADQALRRPDNPNTQITVVIFGKLLLKTFSSTAKVDIDISEDGFSDSLDLIWPRKWDGIRTFPSAHNDAEVNLIANGLDMVVTSLSR